MLAHWTQRNTTYSGLQQYGIGQTDRETGPENERHRERAIERVRPIVTFALGKASGLRRGVQISPMLPIFASVYVSLTPLPSPHSLSPPIPLSPPPPPPPPGGFGPDRPSLVAAPPPPHSGGLPLLKAFPWLRLPPSRLREA